MSSSIAAELQPEHPVQLPEQHPEHFPPFPLLTICDLMTIPHQKAMRRTMMISAIYTPYIRGSGEPPDHEAASSDLFETYFRSLYGSGRNKR